MSIRVKFSIIISLLCLISIIIIGLVSYQYSQNKAIEDAKEKGAIIFNFLESSRKHFKENQKPRIERLIESATDRSSLPTDLISGFALTRGVWQQFQKKNNDYLFRQATIDPIYPENKADEFDIEIINMFKARPEIANLEGITSRNGQSFYYYSKKISVTESCLKCHGNPDNAPEWQKKIYGVEHGYNWREGDITSAYIVYVSIQKALNVAKKNSMIIFIIGSGIVLFLILAIWFCFSAFVSKPLLNLERITTDISLGNNLETPLPYKSNDEIGLLYRAVDRLRISVAKLLHRLNEQ